ncbi:hypothetical protein REH65_00605 [Saccharopolyspora sp. ID03-671]|uniref:hypothetical protein n=1 Tax=Saccharopolyspora sp. ID03-671 TaxID=3073066 RepID=UPI00324C59C8
MSNNNRARSERTRRTAAIIAAAGASGVLIAMGGTGVLAQGPPPPPPAPPAPPSPAPPSPPPLEEQPPGGQAPGQNEGRGDQMQGGIDTGMTVDNVQVVSENLDDNAPEQVRYTFSKPVTDVGNASSFQLSGFSTGATAKAQTAKIVEGDTNAVLTEYAPGTDVRAFTVAITDSQAVQNETGRTNLPNTNELQGGGARVNGTDAPRLESASANPTLDQVTYTFDRSLKDGGANASNLGLYTLDGREIDGKSIVTTDSEDRTVTVQFDSQVEDGVKHFAKADAVTDTRGVQNAPSSVGDPTTAPDLSSVSGLIGRTQFDYTFDQPVTVNSPQGFVAYTADGKAIEGSSVVQPSANVVRVAYPEIQNYGDQISLAAVNQDAVKSSDGSATPNVVGDESIGGSKSGSLTSGPDLTGASLDSGTGQIRLDFDEPIDDNKEYDKSGFQLVTQAGDRIDATSVVEVDESSLLVNFNRAAADAAESVTVKANAVQDEQGNGNLLANKALGGGNGQPSGQLNDQNQSNLNDNRSDLNNNNDNNRSDLNDNQSDNNNQDRQGDLDNGSSNNGPN